MCVVKKAENVKKKNIKNWELPLVTHPSLYITVCAGFADKWAEQK